MSKTAGSTQMPTWLANLIRTAARAITTWISVAWTWNSLKKQWGRTARQARQIREDAMHILGRHPEPETWKSRLRDKVLDSRTVQVLREHDLLPEGTMEKKRGWSFFKVILVLGIIIAVAVFILDRILPKPYRDEELDEAWDEEGEFTGMETAPPVSDEGKDDETDSASNNGASSARKRSKKTAGDDSEDNEE